jgi:hypothetical protein
VTCSDDIELARTPTGIAVLLGLVVGVPVAAVSTVGGDARWLVAAHHGFHGSLSYSTYADATWPPVLRVSEWLFAGFHHALGDRGLLLAHVLAVILTVSIAAVDIKQSGLSDRRTAGLLLVLLGASTSFLIIRLQLFSLPFFAGLLLLLRSETRQASARIWLLVPLLALWSNLHGGALVGAAVACSYLLLHKRSDPAQSVLLLVSSLAALCLTPALLDTPRYYAGVLGNELAREHVGLWAPLDPLGSPFDLALLLCAAILLLVAIRSRPRLWEAVALLGLSVLTVQSARGGVWVLLAAVGTGRPSGASAVSAPPRRVVTAGVLALSCVIAAAVGRGPRPTGADEDLLRQAVIASQGSPVAAEGVLGEQVALAGGCVWVTNPVDAFPQLVQRNYVHWSESGDPKLLPQPTRVALVRRHGRAAERLMFDPAFTLIASRGDVALFVRAVHGGAPCQQWRARH